MRVQRHLREHRQRDVEVEAERADHEDQREEHEHPALPANPGEPFARAGEDLRPLELLEREELRDPHRQQAEEDHQTRQSEAQQTQAAMQINAAGGDQRGLRDQQKDPGGKQRAVDVND